MPKFTVYLMKEKFNHDHGYTILFGRITKRNRKNEFTLPLFSKIILKKLMYI